MEELEEPLFAMTAGYSLAKFIVTIHTVEQLTGIRPKVCIMGRIDLLELEASISRDMPMVPIEGPTHGWSKMEVCGVHVIESLTQDHGIHFG